LNTAGTAPGATVPPHLGLVLQATNGLTHLGRLQLSGMASVVDSTEEWDGEPPMAVMVWHNWIYPRNMSFDAEKTRMFPGKNDGVEKNWILPRTMIVLGWKKRI